MRWKPSIRCLMGQQSSVCVFVANRREYDTDCDDYPDDGTADQNDPE